MTSTSGRIEKTSAVNRHSYYMKMVYCYFLATTASSMRRMVTSPRRMVSTGIFVEAFSVPKRTIQRGARSIEGNLWPSPQHPFISSSALSMSTSTKVDNKQQIVSITKDNPPPLLNLHTITLEEIQELVVSWGHPKFRGKQIYGWIRDKGVTNPNEMNNLPKALRATLVEFTTRENSENGENSGDAGGGALQLAFEAVSKDGTRKRAYELRDGQLIESVLMGPYEDGRYTACISSQAGCAMGCVFCATGQMGFARQLSSDEIFEQVSRFASELKREQDPSKRLSNILKRTNTAV